MKNAMEIRAQSASKAAPAVRPAELNGRLAALRALQKQAETAAPPPEKAAESGDGKGRLLDLRV
jgi:hypothetical protein